MRAVSDPEPSRIAAEEAFDAEPTPSRRPAAALSVGAVVAAIGLLAAAAEGHPYLSLDEVNLGIVLFAVGLFTALFAAPFVLQLTIFASIRGSDRRWERSVLGWAGVAALASLGFGLVGLADSFDRDLLLGAVAWVGLTESLIVLAVVVATIIQD